VETVFDRRLWRSFDYLLLLTVLAIVGISLLVIGSATMNGLSGDNYYVKRQAMMFVVGFILMLIIISTDYTQFYRLSPYLYGINLVLLLVVIYLGRDAGGAQRWIDLRFFNLQPSELAKLIIIISLARHLAGREGNFEHMTSIIPAFIHVAVPMGLIFLQPDLGTALVFFAILFGMLFMAGAKFRHLAAYAVGGAAVGIPLLWKVLKDYQKMRLIVFMNPEMDPINDGFQLIQSMIAVGSGGLRGKGLFAQGTQNSLRFLPESHTDLVFTVLAEQAGFIGAMILILLYVFMIFRILRIGANAKDTFGMLICIGVASMLLFHVLVNIGMTVGMMPVTGLPLPLMSYGGSSMMMNMMAIGLVLSIGMRRNRLMFY
jgi:rod shape determining protein RodA